MDIAELRHEKDHYFGHAHDSPLTVEQRDHFEGLRYFPEDEGFRYTVTVDPEGSGAVYEVEMPSHWNGRLVLFMHGFEELGRRRPDTTKLRELSGWAPLRTLDDAIEDVLARAVELSDW